MSCDNKYCQSASLYVQARQTAISGIPVSTATMEHVPGIERTNSDRIETLAPATDPLYSSCAGRLKSPTLEQVGQSWLTGQ